MGSAKDSKNGRIIATGVNPQGVPWKEISFVKEKEIKKSSKII